jgi:acylphosphatase
MEHLDIVVSGRVQGIGFRFSAMEAAYRFGVTGFVLNRPDSTVYLEAEGKKESVQHFLSWCQKGPLGAKVTDVKVTPGPLQGFTAFDIRRSGDVH